MVRAWDIHALTSRLLFSLQGPARGVALSPDGSRLAVTGSDGDLGIWNVEEKTWLKRTKAHRGSAYRPCWTPDARMVVTCSSNGEIKIQMSGDLQLVHQLAGHKDQVYDIALSPDGDLIASGGADRTVRIWDLRKGAESIVLEGHTNKVVSVRFSSDGKFLGSLSTRELRLWRCRDWECVTTLPRNANGLGGLDFHPSQPLLAAKDTDLKHRSLIDCFKLDAPLLDNVSLTSDSRRYVNAKVVLLGDTGVGKSGLGLVLSGQAYRATDSTHGRNVWTLDAQEVEAQSGGAQTREILLWDLAGQPGYRLVHQLHLGEVAVALMVFDSRSETDPFSGIKHWVRALAQARRLEGSSAVPLRAYLVAARADRGGVAVTKDRIQVMLDDLGLDGFFETSAKEGWQIAELSQAVRDAIVWDALPMVSSSTLFGSIKDFLLEEKERGRLLSTEGRQGQPQLPPFLNALHLVDMRRRDPNPLMQLTWGITGDRTFI